jgi:hypothetical protein
MDCNGMFLEGGVPEISVVGGFDVGLEGLPISTSYIARWIGTIESQ